MFELFCSDSKYRVKNKHLIEKSKTKNNDWILMRDHHNEKISKQLDVALSKELPDNVRKSINDI